MKTLFVVLVTGITFSISVCAQDSIVEKETYRKVDSVFKSYHQQNATGSALAIIKNEKTVYTNQIGLANIEYHQQITDSTVFNIASVSKQFTTFLALFLAEEGKLSFDDDIRQYLPELKSLPTIITIKQLANHTHGLPNPDELAQLKGIPKMTHQQVLAMLLNSKQVNYLAGDKFEYNNTGYILLSEIIERVGQKPFKDQLQERIFSPLGMNHTEVIDNDNIVIHNKAYSYRLSGTTYVNFPVRLSTVGSSGINTTIKDLSLWAKNYQNIKIGKPEFFKKMQRTTLLNSGEEIKYGLGLQFDTYKGIDIVFHGGGTEGYRSYILHAPKHQLSLVILANTGGFLGLDIIYKSLEIILKEFIQEEKPNNLEPDNAALKKFEGTYEMFPGTYYTISSENDALYFQEFDSSEKVLLPKITENAFKIPFIPHSNVVFYKDRFDFHIADFTYPCKKTILQLPKSADINLNDFIGTFKNTEHNISYELVVENNQLIAKHSFTYDIPLKPLTKNSFYSKEPFFGKLDFIFSLDMSVTGFKLSGQNLNNLIFTKLNK